MVLFQKYVRQFGPSTKMVPTAELSLTQDPMGNSHKNLLLRNHLANCNQTLVEQSLDGLLPKLCPVDHWAICNQTLVEQSLDGPLPNLCPVIPTSSQDNGKCSHKNLLVWNQLLNWNQTLIKQSMDGPLPKLCLVVPSFDQDGCTAVLSLTLDPMGNSHKNHLVWNQQLN